MRADFESKIPPHQKLARTKGIPHIGAGAIYPIPDDDITCAPFPIPKEWPRAAGGDVSKTNNAFVWGAWDRDRDILFIYSDYKRADLDVDQNALAYKRQGDWIPLVADAADIRSDEDRRRYIDIMRDDHNIDVEFPDKAVETGLEQVWQRMTGGRLQIFTTCQLLMKEKAMYRRDKQGRIVKVNDHCMDSLRYLVRSGLDRAITKPSGKSTLDPSPAARHISKHGWMG